MKNLLRYGLTLCVGFSLALLCGHAEAVRESLSYNAVTFALFGLEQIPAGETYRGQNGQEIPVSISYTDEAGGRSSFLAVSRIASLLDADLRWDGRSGTVDFGTATTPGASVVNLPFTELVPEGFRGGEMGREHLKNASFQSESAFSQTFDCPPQLGAYVLIQVTNEGEKPVRFAVFRDKTIGNPQPFPTDIIQPRDTARRLFFVAEEATKLTSRLGVTVSPLAGKDFAPLRIRVDVKQQEGTGQDLPRRGMEIPVTENFDGLTMQVTQAAPEKLTVSIKNASRRGFLYGEDAVIERLEEGQWRTCVPQGAVIALGHELRGGEEQTFELSLENRGGALAAGRYRLLKGISEIGSSQDCCTLATEFTI